MYTRGSNQLLANMLNAVSSLVASHLLTRTEGMTLPGETRGASDCVRGPRKTLAGVKVYELSLLTYVWRSAVAAHGNFCLVGVDVDLGMASRAATAVACYDAVVRPLDRHLVNEFHG